MSEFVADCARCGAKKITFSLKAALEIELAGSFRGVAAPGYMYEAFCICRNCDQSSIFRLQAHKASINHIRQMGLENIADGVNKHVMILGVISLKDEHARQPPEHLPSEINAAFREGAICFAVGCYNAAGCMFRLCVDLATNQIAIPEGLPASDKQLPQNLGPRLNFLFHHELLDKALKPIATCIQLDGNDGAHKGTLSQADIEDLSDFTFELLSRLYTDKGRLAEAEKRRLLRSGKKGE